MLKRALIFALMQEEHSALIASVSVCRFVLKHVFIEVECFLRGLRIGCGVLLIQPAQIQISSRESRLSLDGAGKADFCCGVVALLCLDDSQQVVEACVCGIFSFRFHESAICFRQIVFLNQLLNSRNFPVPFAFVILLASSKRKMREAEEKSYSGDGNPARPHSQRVPGTFPTKPGTC